MAKKYIKSYSNYVLKEKHQNANNGTIYERDITTIGGRNQFSKGQIPIYQTGNFVITTNNDNIDHKKTSEKDWYRSDEGEIWTLSTLQHYEKDEKSSYDKKIVIKKDYLDLRDYAYYGSCSELMRVSIDDILKTYPGELFVPYETIYVSNSSDDDVQYTEEAAIAAFGAGGYRIVKSGIKGYYTSMDMSGATDSEKEDVENGFSYKREFKYITDKDGNVIAEKDLALIDNPFGINIHSRFLPKGENPLKYFANGGIDNYTAYLKLDTEGNVSVDGEWYFDSKHEYSIVIDDLVFDGIGETETKEFRVNSENPIKCGGDNKAQITASINVSGELSDCVVPGKYLGRINLSFKLKNYSFKTTPGLKRDDDGNPRLVCCDGQLAFEGKGGEGKYNKNYTKIESFGIETTSHRIEIYLFMGDNNEVKYLVDNNNKANFCVRIRPNKEIIDDFFDGLDLFEKVLLNRDSDPLYTSIFELVGESDYGMYTYIKQFTFPTTYGGYNLGSTSQLFTEYISSLSEVGEYYDSVFTDNLWRSMTHESIKNFDWTYTRHFTPGDEEPYTEGGSKIQKIIRVYGREFDEVKSYINAIDDLNTITYNNINNLPDYFFTDKLEESGWDVKLVHPLELSEFVNGHDTVPIDIHNLFPKKYNEAGDVICTEEAEKLNYFYDSNDVETANKITIKRVFDTKNTSVFPYSISNSATNSKVYSDENEYTSADINSEFMKRLIINSPDILMHKGTIEGLEMLLGVFGLRSKNSVFKNEKYFVNQKVENVDCLDFTEKGNTYYNEYKSNLYDAYDYDIKEYTLFTTREEDTFDETKNMYKFDWVNSTKLISYNNADDNYESYQGLPVSYRVDPKNSGKRFLYPHFNSDDIYDGNPYYQMNGGWMQKKPFMFDISNNIITDEYSSENRNNKELFTETIKNIKCVGTIQELLSNPSLANGNGDICQVTDISGRYAIIDGYVYPLLTDEYDNSDESNPIDYSFFYANISNNSLSVGNAIFTDYVIISNPYFTNGKQKIDLTDEYYSNREIKIYVIKNEDKYNVDVYSKDNSISTFTVFENGKYMDGDNYTNYFIINNIDYYNELSVLGWQQLKDSEYEYYRLNSITDNREGNNPHTGHMRYDNGHEYLTYLQKIFKYVSENDLIDYRQYDEKDISLVDEISNFGFKNLIDSNECEYNYDKFLREDNKCHFFGDILSKEDKRNGLSCFKKRDDNDLSSYSITDIFRKNIIEDSGDTIPTIENLRYGISYSGIGESGYCDIDKIDMVTDQIVNTKRMEIEFYIKNKKEYSKDWLEEVKYIDSIILPYLTQMIPSSIIWDVKYTTVGKEDKWCLEPKGCDEN